MDTPTFHDLYERHARDVHRFARYLTGSADAAEEITAETFFRAWVGRASIRLPTAKAYLLAIARNLAIDEGRRRRRFPSTRLPERAAGGGALESVELRETLEALKTLPPEHREPLALAAGGLGYQEIASVLGLSLPVVKIRIHRARLRLAGILRLPARVGRRGLDRPRQEEEEEP